MRTVKRFYIIFFVCCLNFLAPAAMSQNIDIDILKSINPNPPHPGIWKIASDSHTYFAAAASLGTLAYGLIENDKDVQHKSYEILISIGINVITTDALKVIFNRLRPAEKYPNEIFVLTVSHGYSFPSGHTSLAFATATSLTLCYKKWYVAVPAFLWAGGVGYSRMYLGRHYPSDVLAGAIVGASSSVLSNWLSKKLFEKKTPSQTKPAAL